LTQNHATGIELEEHSPFNADCLVCIHGKQHRLPFKTSRTRASSLGKLIHMDVAGPMETVSLNRNKYLLLIKDNCSCSVWVEPLSAKTQVVAKVWEFVNIFKNGYNACVRGVMADNSTEFMNVDLQNFFKSRGIVFYSSVPYTHQQNGVAEREICTITTMVSFRQDHGIPLQQIPHAR
jgi:hypothetical protein